MTQKHGMTEKHNIGWITEALNEAFEGEKAALVTVKGLTPLLMNSPKRLLDEGQGGIKKAGKKKRDPKEEAEKAAYRLPDGKLYVPSEAIQGTLVQAAKRFKIGKYSAATIASGIVRIRPVKIPLGTKTYEIDIRPVVIQRSRIMRVRPTLKEWKISFVVLFDPSYGVTEEHLKEFLTDAGRRVGILDFRPQHKGDFGRFEIEKWKVIK